MNETLIWVAIWSTLSWTAGMLRGKLLTRKWIKLLLLPGILVDIVLQMIVCMLTATPIQKVSLFKEGKPPLELGPSKLGALAACVGVTVKGLLLLVVAFTALSWFPNFLESGFALPLIDSDTIQSGELNWQSFDAFWLALSRLPEQLAVDTVGGFLVVYSVLGALFAGAICRREWLAWVASWSALFALCWIGQWLGIKFGFLSRGWFIQVLYVPKFWSAFSLLVLATLAVVAVLATARAIQGTLAGGGAKAEKRGAYSASPS